nr:unnamed protein product [Callosobruchus analis]
MLKLITICVVQEQHYLDYYTPGNGMVTKSTLWSHVIKTIVANLKFSDAQHFYNLAYLDSLLSCLVHLTANLEWSGSKPNAPVKSPIPDLVGSLCDLVNAFHSGKGPSAAVSVMGMSITRNVVLVLNHLVAEMLNAKSKGWEMCFLNDVDSGAILRNLMNLWASRDVVLRAAALQLFAGFTTSVRGVSEIVNDLQNSALSSLTCLLRVETYRAFEKIEEVKSPLSTTTSMQNLLDSVRSTKTVVISESNKAHKETKRIQKQPKKLVESQIDLLEELYFGKVFKKKDNHFGVEMDIVESEGEDDSTLISCMEPGKPLTSQEIARRRHHLPHRSTQTSKRLLSGAW